MMDIVVLEAHRPSWWLVGLVLVWVLAAVPFGWVYLWKDVMFLDQHVRPRIMGRRLFRDGFWIGMLTASEVSMLGWLLWQLALFV